MMWKLFLSIGALALSACAEHAPIQASASVTASRAFAGPTQFPPSGFAGYGILAFPSDPVRNPERFRHFCHAYFHALVSSEELRRNDVELVDQMVTVLPINSDTMADELQYSPREEACNIALENYGLLQSQNAITKALAAAERTDGVADLSGRGPFLLAWAPGADYGRQDTLVLVTDLSDSSSPEQIGLDLSGWVRDIQRNPDQWRRGWNAESIRLTAQRWVDRRGAAVLSILGG